MQDLNDSSPQNPAPHSSPAQNLHLTLIQTELHWHNPVLNRQSLQALIEPLAPRDLILLPEMFTTGFCMATEELAETMDGDTVQWMRQIAAQKNAVIAASLMVNAGGHFYNRLLWVRPDGTLEYYDKRHLFRMADEHRYFEAGQQRLVVELKGWRICPLICYDLRFPVWSRNTENFDLLIYLANWPAPRRDAWLSLLKARAIENLCYVAGVNRTGCDNNGLAYSGDSLVYDFKGGEMNPPQNGGKLINITLNYKSLHGFREKFPAHLDADNFSIN
jgi:omega-amidase